MTQATTALIGDEGTKILQAALDRVTANPEGWYQGSWCYIPDEVDPITREHAEAGVYHDFVLPESLIAEIKSEGTKQYGYVPVANCGTAFCLAGNIVVHHGYTFVGSPFSDAASAVVKSDEVTELLRNYNSDGVRMYSASNAALELLGVDDTLNDSKVRVMFNGSNSLLDLWAYGYGFTGGKLKLPESLMVYGNVYTGDDVAREVHTKMYQQTTYNDYNYRDVIDMNLVDPTVIIRDINSDNIDA